MTVSFGAFLQTNQLHFLQKAPAQKLFLFLVYLNLKSKSIYLGETHIWNHSSRTAYISCHALFSISGLLISNSAIIVTILTHHLYVSL